MSAPARQHVATVEEHAPPAQVVTADASVLLSVINRAATDPNFDADKVERMMALYERMEARNAETIYNEAMNAAQEEMRPVAADAHNPQTKSKYASFAALDHALRPVYAKHGFSISFDTADGGPADHIRVVCRVAHRDGHKERPHLDMPCDGKGAKGGDVMTKTHATGAAISYGKRYLLGMIFNIAVGEDRDGNAPASARDQSPASTAAITSLNGCNTVAELKAWKTKNAAVINSLPTREADEIVRLFNTRHRKLQEGAQ